MKRYMNLKTGKAKAVAISPGGRPVYAVYYGEKEDFSSQANYNSAVAARNPAYFAKKDKDTKPVSFFLVPFTDRKLRISWAWLT